LRLDTFKRWIYFLLCVATGASPTP
jgi:hypothetical protein